MELSRRFVFQGYATAVGGRIVRRGEGKNARLIKDGFIDTPGSALTVVGGRSTSNIPGNLLTGDAGEVIKFDKAMTFAEGVFDDLKGHFDVTLGKRKMDELTTTTRVAATVEGFRVGTQIQVVIDRLHSALIARSSSASGETPVEIDPQTELRNVRVIDAAGNVFPLVIELDRGPYSDHNTYSKLMTAANDKAFVKKHGHMLFLHAEIEGRSTPPPAGRILRTDDGQVYGTLVKQIRWKAKPFPESEIDGNMVRLPGWGRAFFGEVLIGRGSRRLTMFRAKLGSIDGGDCGGGDVQDGGTWS